MNKDNQKEETKITEVSKNGLSTKSPIFYIPLALLVITWLAAAVAAVKYVNVAYVNGQPISRLKYIKKLENQGGQQTLEVMIKETLIKSEANKKGIKIDQKEIDDQIATIEKRLKDQGTTLDQALESQGMTKSDLVNQIKIQKMLEKLVSIPKEVNQKEIDDYIAKNKDQFPKTMSKKDIEEAAKSDLLAQAQNDAIDKWLTEAQKNAKIIYR